MQTVAKLLVGEDDITNAIQEQDTLWRLIKK